MITDRQGTLPEAKRIFAALMDGCQRVIDLGCGDRRFTAHMPNTVWVDLDPVKNATDPRVLVIDALEVPRVLRRMHFDAALMTDVIEHISKAEGYQLLTGLEALCDRIILFTPLGELWLSREVADGDPHKHRSGWLAAELEAKGYTTWTWPTFHHFDGYTHGALYAWKFIGRPQPTAEEIAAKANVK